MGYDLIAGKIVAEIRDLKEENERLRAAIGVVCEGWTLPEGARKVLETALWAETVPNGQG